MQERRYKVGFKTRRTEEVTENPYKSWELVTDRLVADGYIGEFNY